MNGLVFSAGQRPAVQEREEFPIDGVVRNLER